MVLQFYGLKIFGSKISGSKFFRLEFSGGIFFSQTKILNSVFERRSAINDTHVNRQFYVTSFSKEISNLIDFTRSFL